MLEPYLGEVLIVAFDFAPRGWAHCDGQLLSVAQNQGLFSLLGTTYGGDGVTTFALPDFRGRTPIHVGSGYSLGQRGGRENVSLGVSALPAHRHAFHATCDDASTGHPGDAKLAPTATRSYRASGELVALHPTAVTQTGGNQPHNNMQPYLALNFVIALNGIYPPRS